MIIEMLAITCNKLSRGIKMLLRAARFQAVAGSQSAHLPAGLPIETKQLAADEAAAECVADAGGIEDLRGRNGRNKVLLSIRVNRRTILPQCNDQYIHALKQFIQVEAGMLLEQLELVLVDKQA